MKAASEIVGRFVADPSAKIAAQSELMKLQADYASKLLDADVAFARAQSETIQGEEKSESWLARNWRPILMLTFTYIIAHNYVIAPMFSWHTLEIVPDMWALLKLGIGGYIMGRSGEKIASSVTETIVASKQ